MRQELELCFGTSFSIVNLTTGELEFAGSIATQSGAVGTGTMCALLDRNRPEFIDEQEPVVVLAIPIADAAKSYVALAPFVVHAADVQIIAQSVMALGYCDQPSLDWAAKQTIWDATRLLSLAELEADRFATAPPLAKTAKRKY